MKILLLTLFFICCLATGGIFVRLSELGPITTGFYRILFSVPILYLLLKNKNNTLLSYKDKTTLFIAGMFLAGDIILWNISFHYTTIANANLLANLVPFTIIPVSYFLYKEKVSFAFLVGLLITVIGLFVLLTGKINLSENNIYGDVLAFLTSIFYAIFLLVVYKIRHKASAMQVMYYSAFGSLAVLLISSLLFEGFSYPHNVRMLYPLLALTLFSQILGQGGLSYILGKISANMASVLVLTQPVISAIFALMIFNEKLSIQEVIGIFIVLTGIFISKKSNK